MFVRIVGMYCSDRDPYMTHFGHQYTNTEYHKNGITNSFPADGNAAFFLRLYSKLTSMVIN